MEVPVVVSPSTVSTEQRADASESIPFDPEFMGARLQQYHRERTSRRPSRSGNHSPRYPTRIPNLDNGPSNHGQQSGATNSSTQVHFPKAAGLHCEYFTHAPRNICGRSTQSHTWHAFMSEYYNKLVSTEDCSCPCGEPIRSRDHILTCPTHGNQRHSPRTPQRILSLRTFSVPNTASKL